MKDDREKLIEEGRKKKLMEQKQQHLENTEEDIERYKKHQRELKSRLAQLMIELKKGIPEGIQKEKLNENKNILESEIKMVDLMIKTYEIRRGVNKLDSEYKELVAKDREGEFVSDLLKSNRIEVELLNKQDKENSDIIKELLKELSEQKKKYRDQYERVDKDKLNELRGNIELSSKAGDRAKSMKKILEEIVKNDEEYKILLRRKKKGESVEDLIKRNRKYAKILAQKNKEKSIEFKKWMKSEEGKKAFELLEEDRRMNPDKARADDIRYEYGLKIIDEIKKNEEEYEKLLKRENKGEYVDDLIKQNLYKAKILAEQNRKYANEEDRRIKPITQEDWQDNQEESEKKHYCTICGKDEAVFLICDSCYKTIITKFMEILDEERKVLEDLMKNDEEYKFLLERKDSGEIVEDLINQNRYQAKILAEKDKENIEKISDIQAELGNKGKKNEEEYEKLLERRNNGEIVDDLINQNRYTRKIIIKQINTVFGESYSQGLKMKLDAKDADEKRKIQAFSQVEIMSAKLGKSIQDFMENHFEYEDLLKREKTGEDVEDLIKQNRINAEVIRTSVLKVQFEKEKWLKMYPDGFQWFQDPIGKQIFLDFFQIGKEKRKIESQKCPNCKRKMKYLENLDAHQCPKCKKKFIIWEKKLTIIGEI